MDFKELVCKARSYRRFDARERVPESVLENLVDAVRCAPSAVNLQPLRYAISTSSAVNDRIFSHLRWAGLLKEWKGPTEAERPTAYIVIGNAGAENRNSAWDLGIAGQTLQLGITAAGYGCCMIGNMDAKAIHAIVDFPEDVRVELVIAIGKVMEDVQLDELAEGQPTAYWRDEQGRHHVPKRPLKAVLLRRFTE